MSEGIKERYPLVRVSSAPLNPLFWSLLIFLDLLSSSQASSKFLPNRFLCFNFLFCKAYLNSTGLRKESAYWLCKTGYWCKKLKRVLIQCDASYYVRKSCELGILRYYCLVFSVVNSLVKCRAGWSQNMLLFLYLGTVMWRSFSVYASVDSLRC